MNYQKFYLTRKLKQKAIKYKSLIYQLKKKMHVGEKRSMSTKIIHEIYISGLQSFEKYSSLDRIGFTYPIIMLFQL